MADYQSYEGFAKGDYVARKGRLCIIQDIDFTVNPPTFTVFMIDTQNPVGTEFDRLQQIESWQCSICTAANGNIGAYKCEFCRMDRKWTESLILKDNEPDKIKDDSHDTHESKADQKQNEDGTFLE